MRALGTSNYEVVLQVVASSQLCRGEGSMTRRKEEKLIAIRVTVQYFDRETLQCYLACLCCLLVLLAS